MQPPCSMRRSTHLRRWWIGRLVGGQMGRHNIRRVIKGHDRRRKSGRKCLNAHAHRDKHLRTAAVECLCVAVMSVLHLMASHRTAVGENVGAEASILVGAVATSNFLGSTGHLKRGRVYNVHEAGMTTAKEYRCVRAHELIRFVVDARPGAATRGFIAQAAAAISLIAWAEKGRS